MTKSFLQSQTWEGFQQAVGNKTLRIDGVLIIEKKLPLGKKYWYIPRADIDLQKLAKEAKESGLMFVRIDPLEPLPQNLLYSVKKVADVQPSQTVILNLTPSEEKILAGMHPKTRYNIRLAQKKGVMVRAADAVEFDSFWGLMEATTKRDKFRSHDKEYYRLMLERCKPNGIATSLPSVSPRNDMFIKLFFAEYNGDVVAAGIVAFYEDSITYVHGASSNKNREVMAPYALHWQIMQIAKKEGYEFYDLFGVSEKRWPGVTRFKKGFGGKEVNYPGTFDIIFNKSWYKKYTFVRKLRRLV